MLYTDRSREDIMKSIKIYGYGVGGAHRASDPRAAAWRNLTTKAAIRIRAAYPKMDHDVVLMQAQDETATALYAARRAVRSAA